MAEAREERVVLLPLDQERDVPVSGYLLELCDITSHAVLQRCRVDAERDEEALGLAHTWVAGSRVVGTLRTQSEGAARVVARLYSAPYRHVPVPYTSCVGCTCFFTKDDAEALTVFREFLYAEGWEYEGLYGPDGPVTTEDTAG